MLNIDTKRLTPTSSAAEGGRLEVFGTPGMGMNLWGASPLWENRHRYSDIDDNH